MDHFILQVDKNYIAPTLNNCNVIRPLQLVDRRAFNRLPNRLLFSVDKRMQTVYTDIITFPNFLISKKVKDIVKLYQPYTPVKQVILCDQGKKSFLYYIPFLERVECLTANSSLNLNRSFIYQAQIDGKKVKDRALFRVAGVDCVCIMIREDLAESLLCRDTIGIGLQETETIYEGG